MPRIVNKLQKRQDIALCSTQLFCDKGFHNLTVSEVAKNANVAKGSIYEYFDNKEDIVFAIIEYAQDIYDNEVLYNVDTSNSIQEKILYLFDLCISTTPDGIQRRKIYKEFISICLTEPSPKMIQFQNDIKIKYISWLKNILIEGINNKQLKPNALEFADGLFAMAEGVLLFSHFDNYHEKDILESYINSLFKLITIKGQKDD